MSDHDECGTQHTNEEFHELLNAYHELRRKFLEVWAASLNCSREMLKGRAAFNAVLGGYCVLGAAVCFVDPNPVDYVLGTVNLVCAVFLLRLALKYHRNAKKVDAYKDNVGKMIKLYLHDKEDGIEFASLKDQADALSMDLRKSMGMEIQMDEEEE